MKKTEAMNEYLDWYAILLTKKQQEICDLYFKEDFSLSEISENYQISRAAVLDTIKRSQMLMEDYEKKLHLIEKYHARKEIYDKIRELNIQKINDYLDEIEDLD
ncbi:MAG: YlxM family DNA-binding protein [Traorella sp.]